MKEKVKPDSTTPGYELSKLIEQEEKYVFDHFTQEDARKMAFIMFQVCDEYKLSFALQIYLNGMVVFKFLPEGRGKFNDLWMEKKIATVMLTGWSTMRTWAMQESVGKKRPADLFPQEPYVMCGGGFPIKVKGAGLVGALICSGSSDQEDHEFILEVLERYFKEVSTNKK